jgi:hypothetical protein
MSTRPDPEIFLQAEPQHSSAAFFVKDLLMIEPPPRRLVL